MKWGCPYCSQRSGRKWNIEVHIKRIHSENGLPMPMDHESRAKQGPYPSFKSYSKPDSRNSKLRGHFGDDLWLFPRENTDSQSKDWFDDIMKLNDRMMDLFRSPRPNYRQPSFPQFFYQSASRGPIPNYNTGYNPYQSITEPDAENVGGVIGFKARICKTCLITIIIPSVLQQGGRDRTRFEHYCDPNRVYQIQQLDTDQKNKLNRQLDQNLPSSLFRKCKEWAKEGFICRHFG